jgi:hypothetical protein
MRSPTAPYPLSGAWRGEMCAGPTPAGTLIIKARRQRRLAVIPEGCWPRRLRVELAAGYVGEKTIAAFVGRVRKGEYPAPTVSCEKRQLWLKDDLDRAIGAADGLQIRDVAEDL